MKLKLMIAKKWYSKFLILCFLATLCSFKNYAFAQQVDKVRVQKIAKGIIKMQTLDDRNYKNNNLAIVQLMVGNSTDKKEIHRFLDKIPNEGIANHLRKINTEGLNSEQSKAMIQVIDEEIKQVSDLFRSCHVLPEIQQINEKHVSISINCFKPVLNSSQIYEFEKYIHNLSEVDKIQYKIMYLKAKQRFLAQATLKPYQSNLQIYIEDKNIYRAAIEEAESFPNIFLDQRDRALMPPPKGESIEYLP
jgi:hypothetical protein